MRASCPQVGGPHIRGALSLIAVAGTLVAPTAHPHTPVSHCGEAGSFRQFSSKVWAPSKWRRGSPPPKALEAKRKRLDRAEGCGYRGKLRARWRHDQAAYFAHRKLVLSTRCGSPSCNKRLGWLISHRRGVDRGEFDGCLVPLWDRESGWEEEVWNTSGSGAGGIPQALPASKMGPAANPDVGGWEVAREQIKWGLDYLADVYGGPCGGYEHSNANGWY